jgi:hypothetical protein
VTDAWLAGARRLYTHVDGGWPKGGAPRAVWHTSESDPQVESARSAASRLAQRGRCAHLVWNPFTGETVQMVPATQSALMLDGDVNREGRYCLQIVVVGRAVQPFTDTPMRGVESIMTWIETWRVARRWPAGRPLPSPAAYHGARGRGAWSRGGHFGASQVPGTDGAGPGSIDITLIAADPLHPARRRAPDEIACRVPDEVAPAEIDELLTRRPRARLREPAAAPAHIPS